MIVARPLPTPEQFAARFWGYVDRSGECWLWTGDLDRHGYGRIHTAGKRGPVKAAHRVSYELTLGAIPPGLELDHTCRNPRCVRPDHLDPVTHRENLLRGTGIAARNAAVTHCPQGHPERRKHLDRQRWSPLSHLCLRP